MPTNFTRFIPKVFSILRKEVPKYHVPIVDLIEVQTHDPFKVLIATILSARTKDDVTAKASNRLFSRVKTFKDLENMPEEDIADLIYPVGFYKTKAYHLKQLPMVIKEKFHEMIPETIDELTMLPGVGRKTANLVMAVAFHKPAIAVDTHCHRITQRLGWLKSKNPHETEKILRKILPEKYWLDFNKLFVAFGQNVCKPLNPQCLQCPIKRYCNYRK